MVADGGEEGRLDAEDISSWNPDGDPGVIGVELMTVVGDSIVLSRPQLRDIASVRGDFSKPQSRERDLVF